MHYHLEIAGPGDHNVYASFESNSPFMPFHAGDLLNPLQFDCGVEDCRLKVVGCEHVVFKHRDGQMAHKLMVDVIHVPTGEAYEARFREP